MMKYFSTNIVPLALAAASVSAAPGTPLVQRDGLPPVQSNQLRSLLTEEALLNRAEKLQSFANYTPAKNRVAGSVGHNLTVSYIYDTLVNTGYYDVELQPFIYASSMGNVTVSVGNTTYAAEYFDDGPSGNVKAPLVPVANLGCNATDFHPNVSGNIAFISRGNCDFGLKVALAGAAGAQGAIIYNNVPGPIHGSLLVLTRPEGKYVPTGSISQEDGKSLLATISGGTTVTANLSVDAIIDVHYTNNVIATSKIGDRSNIIFSGGHTDSVQEGPGIDDNGSGSMGILEIAYQLTNFSVTNAVRFGFWSGEEDNLVGSKQYVTTASADELSKISLYLNFDMIASPNFGYFIYNGPKFNVTVPPGSDKIEDLFKKYFKSVGLKTAPTAFDGRSDFQPFLDVGIPSGGLFTGAEANKTAKEVEWWGGTAGIAYDVNYHSARDDIKNLNTTAWIQNTKAAAHAIATYAISTQGIPKRAGQHKRSMKRNKPPARSTR